MPFGRNNNSGFGFGGGGKRSGGLSFGGHNTQGGSASGLNRSPMQGNLAERQAKHETHMTMLKVGAGVAAALLVAFLVGLFVYQQTSRAALKPTLDTASLSTVLTPVTDEAAPYWSVFAHTDSQSAEEGRGNLVDLAFVYVDSDNRTCTFLWVPTDTRVYIDGYGNRYISDAFDLQQETGLTRSMASIGDMPIAHYIELSDAGLSRFSSDLGSLDFDPATADRTALVQGFARKIFGSSSEQISHKASTFTTCFATDADSSVITAAFTAMQGMNVANDFYIDTMPSTLQEIGGTNYSIVTSDTWKSMVDRVSSGMSPIASKSELTNYEVLRDSSNVTIWNGAGVSGCASDLSDELKKLGWTVESTGNAAQFVYDETLIVYKDNDDEGLAQLLVSDLGQGRAVRSAARYSFKGTILVVIGKDYQPY